VQYRKSEEVYSQGDAAASVMYIQNGGIKIAVVNEAGKEAVVAMLDLGLLWRGLPAGQKIRMGTATAIMPTAVLAIEKNEMVRALHAEHALSTASWPNVLSRNIRIEEDLIDQLFNSARNDWLERFCCWPLWQGTPPGTDAPESVSGAAGGNDRHDAVAGEFFMNRFKKMGFIRYNGGLQVHSSSSASCCTIKRRSSNAAGDGAAHRRVSRFSGEAAGAKMFCGSKADLRRRIWATPGISSAREFSGGRLEAGATSCLLRRLVPTFRAGGAKRSDAWPPEAKTRSKIWAMDCERRAVVSSFADAGSNAK